MSSSSDDDSSAASPPSPISSVAESPTVMSTPKKKTKSIKKTATELSVVNVTSPFRSPKKTDRENSQFETYVREERQIPKDRIYYVDEGFQNGLRDIGVINIVDEISDCGTKSLAGKLLHNTKNPLCCCM